MVAKPDNSENIGNEVVFEFKRYVWINAEARRKRNRNKYKSEQAEMYQTMENRTSEQPQQANLIAPGEIMLFLGEEKEAQSSITTENQKDDTKKEKKGKRAHEAG
ncbi:unnamed protein product [Auanema sp. JU1783]|nr:unnamed protein product [Auanema sp. JU1783]